MSKFTPHKIWSKNYLNDYSKKTQQRIFRIHWVMTQTSPNRKWSKFLAEGVCKSCRCIFCPATRERKAREQGKTNLREAKRNNLYLACLTKFGHQRYISGPAWSKTSYSRKEIVGSDQYLGANTSPMCVASKLVWGHPQPKGVPRKIHPGWQLLMLFWSNFGVILMSFWSIC